MDDFILKASCNAQNISIWIADLRQQTNGTSAPWQDLFNGIPITCNVPPPASGGSGTGSSSSAVASGGANSCPLGPQLVSGYPAACRGLAAVDASPPVLITSAGDFDNIQPNHHYELANDISLPATWTDPWVSSGVLQNFVLDGAGHTLTVSTGLLAANINCGIVRNLTVSGSISPLFISTENSVLQGITINGPQITYMGPQVGAIAGYDSNSLYSGIQINGGQVGGCNGPATAGGVVGLAQGTELDSSSNSAAVYSVISGGIVGTAQCGSFSGVSNSGSVGGQQYAGGILGAQNGPLSLSGANNSGTVKAYHASGGLVGNILNSAGAIQSSSSAGPVWGTLNKLGGIWGAGAAVIQNVSVTAPLNTGTFDACN